MRKESSECDARRAVVRQFQIDTAKKFLMRKFNMMLRATAVVVGRSGLTEPGLSGISHAHAGLAKLRPVLPPNVFVRDCCRRPPVTPPNRVSRNEGRSVATKSFTTLQCGAST
jgi:hypothetical protein